MSVRKLRHQRPSGWFSKSRGLSASVSFLSSQLPPRSFTCGICRAAFYSRSSFFGPKPHRNACYAGYILINSLPNGFITIVIKVKPNPSLIHRISTINAKYSIGTQMKIELDDFLSISHRNRGL